MELKTLYYVLPRSTVNTAVKTRVCSPCSTAKTELSTKHSLHCGIVNTELKTALCLP